MKSDELESKIEEKELELAKIQQKWDRYTNPVSLGRDTPPSIPSESMEDFRAFNKITAELKGLRSQRVNLSR